LKASRSDKDSPVNEIQGLAKKDVPVDELLKELQTTLYERAIRDCIETATRIFSNYNRPDYDSHSEFNYLKSTITKLLETLHREAERESVSEMIETLHCFLSFYAAIHTISERALDRDDSRS
jgi:hypothetical protein